VKVRELRAALAKIGCRLVRCRGSHETWASPRGTPMPPVVVKHAGDDVSFGVYVKIARVLASEGILIDRNCEILVDSETAATVPSRYSR
jgi:predicted RNA binding protein YcfA (HicA-like mRNA interferase family)